MGALSCWCLCVAYPLHRWWRAPSYSRYWISNLWSPSRQTRTSCLVWGQWRYGWGRWCLQTGRGGTRGVKATNILLAMAFLQHSGRTATSPKLLASNGFQCLQKYSDWSKSVWKKIQKNSEAVKDEPHYCEGLLHCDCTKHNLQKRRSTDAARFAALLAHVLCWCASKWRGYKRFVWRREPTRRNPHDKCLPSIAHQLQNAGKL